MSKTEQRTRLGKGLGALLGEYLDETELAGAPVKELRLGSVRPNPFQPRREVQEASLDELEASIRENGLLQPLVVRPAGAGWELVAGERRWRVLRRLGWESAPAIVRELSDEQMLVLALVENLQREELGALEEAVAYQQLIDGFGLTQREVARRVGRERSTVANSLRLLMLPASVQELLAGGAITAGHARAILSVPGEHGQEALAREIAAKGLSVREAERRARSGADLAARKRIRKVRFAADPIARRAEILLSRAFGTEVRVTLRARARGEVRIPFQNADDFERVARLLLDEPTAAELFEAE